MKRSRQGQGTGTRSSKSIRSFFTPAPGPIIQPAPPQSSVQPQSEVLEAQVVEVRNDHVFVGCHDLGDLAAKMVQTERNTVFKLVYILVVLALTLPVATATVERAFSAMKFVKNELRNKKGGEWLNHMMVCYIERDIFASIKDDEILYHFQELKSRMNKLPSLSQIRESGSGSDPYEALDDDMRDDGEPNHN